MLVLSIAFLTFTFVKKKFKKHSWKKPWRHPYSQVHDNDHIALQDPTKHEQNEINNVAHSESSEDVDLFENNEEIEDVI